MALDPITAYALIKGGTALAKGISGAVGASSQAKAERERAEQIMRQAEGITEGAEARRSQYGLGTSYGDLRRLVMQDPTSDYLRQQAQRQEAGQMEALRAGGARALIGGTQAVGQNTMDRLARIAQEEQTRKARGLQIVGEAEQRVARERLADARTDLSFGRQMTAEAQAALFGADDLRRMGRQSAISAGLDAAGSIAAGSIEGIGDEDASLLEMINAKDGAVIRGKTPGEFSHEENPIDILQDGKKIGEMTGGEGVVSPEDLGKLEQLAGEGKTPLHKFVRGLIKKLEKNG